jgi:hypothetical protein
VDPEPPAGQRIWYTQLLIEQCHQDKRACWAHCTSSNFSQNDWHLRAELGRVRFNSQYPNPSLPRYPASVFERATVVGILLIPTQPGTGFWFIQCLTPLYQDPSYHGLKIAFQFEIRVRTNMHLSFIFHFSSVCRASRNKRE